MEWLSKEEKSSSMMPYLLELPPLDEESAGAAKTQDKAAPLKTKKAIKEVEAEKWHCATTNDPKTLVYCDVTNSNHSPPTDSKMNCDRPALFLFNLKTAKSKQAFINLSDVEMRRLRELALSRPKGRRWLLA